MQHGILLKLDRIPVEDGLHLIQFLRSNGFEPVDINTQRPAQVRMAIKEIRAKKKTPVLVDVLDEYQPNDRGEDFVLDDFYPVLEVTETDEIKTLSLIQESLGIVAYG